MTATNKLQTILTVVDPIIEAAEGHIGTHSATCYQYHAACLAVLVADIIRE